MAAPRPDSPYTLLVEGSDDQHSIIQLLARHGYVWEDDSIVRPFVRAVGGIDQVLKIVETGVKSLERIGVVVDADTSANDQWERLRDRLRRVGYEIPRVPPSNGLVVEGSGDLPRLGAWLMPDNVARGAIEEFVRTLVPAGDAIWPHAETSTTRALELGATLRHKMKGTVHAWLAWQARPGLPLGAAIKACVLGHDSAEAALFVAWFHRLFGAAR